MAVNRRFRSKIRVGRRKIVFKKKTFAPKKRSGPSKFNTMSGFNRGDVFPPRWFGKLKYCTEDLALTSTAGAYATNTWRINSCYDPDSTGVGGQPRGFDQVCASSAPYYRYRVHACHIRVELMNADNTDQVEAYLCWFGGNTTAPTSIREARERTDCKTVRMTGTTGGQRTAVVMSKYVRVSDVFGISKSEVNNDLNYSAAYNANPAQTGYWQVGIAATAGGDAIVYGTATLTYYVEFIQRNDIPDS